MAVAQPSQPRRFPFSYFMNILYILISSKMFFVVKCSNNTKRSCFI